MTEVILLSNKVFRKEFQWGEDFNTEKYFELLQTKSLGQVLVYVPVCESTMKISKRLTIFNLFEIG